MFIVNGVSGSSLHCINFGAATDEGCGIASEDIVLIKQKGYTGKLGREKKQATGMGLYFVKEICERLHIKWQISSQWQHGTKVSLYPVKERLMDR